MGAMAAAYTMEHLALARQSTLVGAPNICVDWDSYIQWMPLCRHGPASFPHGIYMDCQLMPLFHISTNYFVCQPPFLTSHIRDRIEYASSIEIIVFFEKKKSTFVLHNLKYLSTVWILNPVIFNTPSSPMSKNL